MKKKIMILFLFVLTICLMGCKEKNEKGENNKPMESEFYLYYLDNKETQVVREPYTPKGSTVKEQLSEYVEALRERKPKDLTYKKALPDYVTMTVNEDIENEQLTLYFDDTYSNLEGASEVLCRAAIVKTFCQIEGIKYVEFIVDDQPLKDSRDVLVGFMKAEDFIDNTGGETKYEQNAVVILYFADKSGEKLVDTRVNIKYDGTIPLEQLVINQLIKGPNSIEGVKEGEILPTIPDKTVLNKITVKDSICYIDFSANFLKGREGISNRAIIYSISNSLIEIPEVSKVQFAIDGEQVTNFGEGVRLDIPIERNLDIVVKNK